MEALIFIALFIFIMMVFGKNNSSKGYRETYTSDTSVSKKRKSPAHTPLKPKKASYRVNHCYNCKTTVDSRVDKVCPECNWIACSTCGACSHNCHYEHQPKSARPALKIEESSAVWEVKQQKDANTNGKSYYEDDGYEYRDNAAKENPREYAVDGKSFYMQLEKDIEAAVQLSDYQIAILQRFKPFVKRTETAFPMFMELLEAHELPNTYYIAPVLELLNEHSLRKKKAWWNSVNECVRPTDYFDDSPMADAKNDYLDEQERRDEDVRKVLRQSTSGLMDSE